MLLRRLGWLRSVLCHSPRLVQFLYALALALTTGLGSATVLPPPYLQPAFQEAPQVIAPVYVRGAWRRIGAWRLTTTDDGLPIRTPITRQLPALSANTKWDVRTGGSDTNGGGFVSGASGTDWSQQNAAQYAVTDGVTAGTTTITSLTANFGTDVVGNIMYVAGGTGSITANWYQITARASSTSITVDRSTGLTAGTGVTLNIGGSLLSPAIACSVAVASNVIYIKDGTFSITSASTNVAGGCLSPAATVTVEGYQTTHGDLGTRPILQASGISTFTILNAANNDIWYRNLEVDGASLTSSRGYTTNASRIRATLVKISNCTNTAFNSSTGGVYTQCQATASNLGFNNSASLIFWIACVANANTGVGFTSGGNGTAIFCIADSNTGATTDGFQFQQTIQFAINCDAYNNGRDGFRFQNATSSAYNCIAETNGGWGFDFTAGANQSRRNCATYNNTSGAVTGTVALSLSNVTGSGSFFTNAAGGDFTLNNTAGGGALCRGAGYPGVLPAGGTGYIDIGALQHADPTATVMVHIIGR